LFQPKPVRLRSVIAEAVHPPQDTIVSLDRTYDYVLTDATAANLILTLPSAGSVPCQPMTIRRKDNTSHYAVIRPQDSDEIFGKHEYQGPGKVVN
jgi:hypothetical protein